MAYKPRRLFKPKKGIDLKSSETMRGEDYLSYAENIVYDGQGNICKRPGTHLRVYGIDASSGMTLFETTDYKGVSKSEIVFLGTNTGKGPMRVIKRNLNIANATGSAVVATVVWSVANSRYELQLTGGVTSTINLGTGLVGGDLTIAGLIATVVAGITFSSTSSIGAVKAAFLETKSETILNGANADFAYYSTEAIPYGGYAAAPTITPAFPVSNPTSTLINGSLYWYGSHSGTDTVLMKYDGQTWYKAGLPFVLPSPVAHVANGVAIVDSKGSRASLSQPSAYDDGDVWGKMATRCVFKDKAGAIHYGDFIEGSYLAVSGANANGATSVCLPYITSILPNLGLTYENARSAKGNGVQNNTLTITVDAGHTLAIGDVAYFWSTSHSRFIEREITNIGATSITVSTNGIDPNDTGGVVSVYDNCIISNNFRLEYFYVDEWLTTGFGTTRQRPNIASLIAIVPMNTIDSTYGTRTGHPDIYAAYPTWAVTEYLTESYKYIYSGATPYSPPTGKFVTSTSNGSTLLVSGNSDSDNTVYSSTADDPESFYLGRNAFTVDGTVTALGSSGAVAFVATKKQSYAVQGDIPSLNFRCEKITENLGVISPSSVVEIDEGAIHFNTIKGPFMLLGGRELKPVGEWPLDKRISIVEPYFTYTYTPRNAATYEPSFDVSSAYVLREKKWIILNVPWNASATYSFANSATFVYDYSMGGWFNWTGIDASCGAVYWDGKAWFAGQGAGSTVNLVSMVDPTGVASFSDHGAAITAKVRYHWENAGDINLYKKFLWMTVFTPPGVGSAYTVDVKSYVNYETTQVNSWVIPVTQHSNFSLTASPPAYTVEAKLKSGKFASLMLELSNSTVHQGLWISGTEIDIAAPLRVPSRPGRSDA